MNRCQGRRTCWWKDSRAATSRGRALAIKQQRYALSFAVAMLACEGQTRCSRWVGHVCIARGVGRVSETCVLTAARMTLNATDDRDRLV